MRKIRITYVFHFHIRLLINGFWCRQKSFCIDVLISRQKISSSVRCPIELFNFHKIKLHVKLYNLSPFMIVFDWISYSNSQQEIFCSLRKCHNRYSFMISSIVMFYVFSYLSQHDDLLTTSSVTLQHMMWFSFTTTTSFWCYKIIRMESGNRTTTKQIFSWSINEDVLLVQTLWNLNRNWAFILWSGAMSSIQKSLSTKWKVN